MRIVQAQIVAQHKDRKFSYLLIDDIQREIRKGVTMIIQAEAMVLLLQLSFRAHLPMACLAKSGPEMCSFRSNNPKQ